MNKIKKECEHNYSIVDNGRTQEGTAWIIIFCNKCGMYLLKGFDNETVGGEKYCTVHEMFESHCRDWRKQNKLIGKCKLK